MMNIVSKCAVAALSAACIAEGYYLGLMNVRKGTPAEEFQTQHEGWTSELERRAPGTVIPDQGERDPHLGKALEEWFHARALDTGIRTDVATTDNHVVVSFVVPGLRPESLHVAVNGLRMTISCVAKLAEVKREAHGAYRREAMRQYEMIMPVPSNADARRHRIVREGETFKIIFEKADDPSLKS